MLIRSWVEKFTLIDPGVYMMYKNKKILVPVEIRVKPEWLDYYHLAIEAGSQNEKRETVPATAIAGRAMIKLLKPLNLPSGVVHTKATVESISQASIGDTLICEGAITGLIKRIGIEVMTVSMTVKKLNQEEILKAEMTFKLPDWQLVGD